MLNLKKIAVTGGLSSGKSTVCRIFKELGAYVISADDIAHQILLTDSKTSQQVIQLIGKEVSVNGIVDRSKVAQKVFHQPLLLSSLEKILHPPIRRQIQEHFKIACMDPHYSLFVAEVPLLFEAQMEGDFDATVAVLSDLTSQKHRYLQKGKTSEDFDRRIQRQLTSEEKAQKADFVIHNNGSLQDLEYNVNSLYSKLINL